MSEMLKQALDECKTAHLAFEAPLPPVPDKLILPEKQKCNFLMPQFECKSSDIIYEDHALTYLGVVMMSMGAGLILILVAKLL